MILFLKKIWRPFFVLSVLTHFGFINSMIKPLFFLQEGKKILPPPKKIIDLCFDCSCYIFQFSAEKNNLKPSLELRLVCKKFQKTIDECPCFLFSDQNKANQPIFFRHVFNVNQCDFKPGFPPQPNCEIKLYNTQAVTSFLQTPLPSHIKDTPLKDVLIKLNKKNIIKFLNKYLKNLIFKLSNSCLRFRLLIYTSSEKELAISFIKLNEALTKQYFDFGNPTITYNFNIFGSIKEIGISGCNNFNFTDLKKTPNLKHFKHISWFNNLINPIGELIKDANVENAKNNGYFLQFLFNGEQFNKAKPPLKQLENLRKLFFMTCCKNCEKKIKNQNLKSITNIDVAFCKNFDGKSLEKLKNLGTLQIACCKKFNQKNLKKLRKLRTIKIDH